jgi:hypothetical protein
MKSTLRKTKQNLKKQLNLVSNIVTDTKEFVNKVKYGNTDIPFSMREMLKQVGGEQITKLQLIRNPVNQVLIKLMNAFSGFTLENKLNNSPYDSLFHLKLRINDKYDYEKEEVTKLRHKTDSPNQEYMDIMTVPNISINDFIQNHMNIMGTKNYLSYDGRTNNCQIFIVNALHGSGINNSTWDGWILQNVEFIFENNPNPLFHGLMNKITDIGNRVVLLKEGGDLDVSNKSTLTNFDIEDICKILKLGINGVFMKDEIDLNNLKNGNFVMNLQNHNESGSHWVAFVKKGKQIYYSDSFGCPPPQNEMNIFHKQHDELYYNKKVVQDINSHMCGWFAMLFLYFMKNEKGSMAEKLNKYPKLFDIKNAKNNDQILRNIFKHLFEKNKKISSDIRKSKK